MKNLSMLVVTCLTACGDDNNNYDGAADATSAMTAGTMDGNALAGTADAELASDDSDTRTTKIGSMMHTLNDGEITLAMTAKNVTHDASANAFAAEMISMHQENDTMLQALMTDARLAYADNSVSAMMRSEASASME